MSLPRHTAEATCHHCRTVKSYEADSLFTATELQRMTSAPCEQCGQTGVVLVIRDRRRELRGADPA